MKNNKFIEKFTSNPENEAENIMLLDFDTSQKMTKYEKDSIIADALKIYENPELYASNPDNPQDIREIQDHVENLFMNAFIVNGFRISNNSYIDLIPVEYFTNPRFSRYGQTIEKDERFDKSIVDYYKSQNLQDPNYFGNFMVDYMRQHGTRYVGGKPMLKRSKVLRLNPILPGKATDPVFKVFTTKTGDAATYLMGMAVKNGFYHPKKLYTIFYQDKYKREWGQVGDALYDTPNGEVEVTAGVVYLGKEKASEAWVPHIHELFHALGFVQLCAPGAIIERNSRWGKNDHLNYKNDITVSYTHLTLPTNREV